MRPTHIYADLYWKCTLIYRQIKGYSSIIQTLSLVTSGSRSSLYPHLGAILQHYFSTAAKATAAFSMVMLGTPGALAQTQSDLELSPRPDGLNVAKFSLWLPKSITQPVDAGQATVRAVLCVSEYEAGTKIFADPRWRTFAEEQIFAILLHQLRTPAADRNLSRDATGLAAIETALAHFAKSTGRPELASAPLIHTGLSQSGWQAIAFGQLRPDRTLAVIAYHAASSARAPDLATTAAAIPTLYVIAERDRFLPAKQQHAHALSARAAGADRGGSPWAALYEVNVEHHRLGEPSFAMAWLRAIADARLPKPDAPASGLIALDIKKGWAGRFQLDAEGKLIPASVAISPLDGDNNSPTTDADAYWLPSEPIARAWEQYLRRPDANDIVPPAKQP